MKAIQDNSPYILGSLAYYACATMLAVLFWFGTSFLVTTFFTQPSNYVYLFLWIIVQALASYLSFVVSTWWVALPILKRINKIAKKPKQESLFVEWFLFSIFIYTLGSLPVSFLPMLPITKNIQSGISFIWITIVVFSLYKDSIASYAFRFTEKIVNEDNF